MCECECVCVYYICLNCDNQTWPNISRHTLGIFLLNNKLIFKLIIKSLYHCIVCSPCSKSRMPRSQNALSGSACRLGNSNSFCCFALFLFFSLGIKGLGFHGGGRGQLELRQLMGISLPCDLPPLDSFRFLSSSFEVLGRRS